MHRRLAGLRLLPAQSRSKRCNQKPDRAVVSSWLPNPVPASVHFFQAPFVCRACRRNSLAHRGYATQIAPASGSCDDISPTSPGLETDIVQQLRDQLSQGQWTSAWTTFLSSKSHLVSSLTEDDFDSLFEAINHLEGRGIPTASSISEMLIDEMRRIKMDVPSVHLVSYLEACSIEGKFAEFWITFKALRARPEPVTRRMYDLAIQTCLLAKDARKARLILKLILLQAGISTATLSRNAIQFPSRPIKPIPGAGTDITREDLILPDAAMFALLISTAVAARHVNITAQLCDTAAALGLDLDGSTLDKVLYLFASSHLGPTVDPNLLQRALDIYSVMITRSVKVKDVELLIRKLSLAGRPDDALLVLQESIGLGRQFNAHTYQYVIASFLKLQNLARALSVYLNMKKIGVIPTHFTCRGLLHFLRKELTLSNFDKMKMIYADMKILGVKFDASIYAILLTACAQQNDYNTATSQFKDARRQGVQLSPQTYRIVVRMAAHNKDLPFAKALVDKAKRLGYRLDAATFEILIDALLASADVAGASHCVMRMIDAEAVSFGAVKAFLKEAIRNDFVLLAIEAFNALGSKAAHLSPAVQVMLIPHLAKHGHIEGAMTLYKTLIARNHHPAAPQCQSFLNELILRNFPTHAAFVAREMSNRGFEVRESKLNSAVQMAIVKKKLDHAKQLIIDHAGSEPLSIGNFQMLSKAFLNQNRVHDVLDIYTAIDGVARDVKAPLRGVTEWVRLSRPTFTAIAVCLDKWTSEGTDMRVLESTEFLLAVSRTYHAMQQPGDYLTWDVGRIDALYHASMAAAQVVAQTTWHDKILAACSADPDPLIAAIAARALLLDPEASLDARSYAAVMTALRRANAPEQAADLHQRMRQDGIVDNAGSLAAACGALLDCNRLDDAKNLLFQILAENQDLESSNAYSDVLDALMQKGSWLSAREVVDQVRQTGRPLSSKLVNADLLIDLNLDRVNESVQALKKLLASLSASSDTPVVESSTILMFLTHTLSNPSHDQHTTDILMAISGQPALYPASFHAACLKLLLGTAQHDRLAALTIRNMIVAGHPLDVDAYITIMSRCMDKTDPATAWTLFRAVHVDRALFSRQATDEHFEKYLKDYLGEMKGKGLQPLDGSLGKPANDGHTVSGDVARDGQIQATRRSSKGTATDEQLLRKEIEMWKDQEDLPSQSMFSLETECDRLDPPAAAAALLSRPGLVRTFYPLANLPASLADLQQSMRNINDHLKTSSIACSLCANEPIGRNTTTTGTPPVTATTVMVPSALGNASGKLLAGQILHNLGRCQLLVRVFLNALLDLDPDTATENVMHILDTLAKLSHGGDQTIPEALDILAAHLVTSPNPTAGLVVDTWVHRAIRQNRWAPLFAILKALLHHHNGNPSVRADPARMHDLTQAAFIAAITRKNAFGPSGSSFSQIVRFIYSRGIPFNDDTQFATLIYHYLHLRPPLYAGDAYRAFCTVPTARAGPKTLLALLAVIKLHDTHPPALRLETAKRVWTYMTNPQQRNRPGPPVEPTRECYDFLLDLILAQDKPNREEIANVRMDMKKRNLNVPRLASHLLLLLCLGAEDTDPHAEEERYRRLGPSWRHPRE
ncbi:hypothetical protein DFJ77DRAFT_552343 [Powellomyces hirtus]|nr:hypothetical protein DFJ77DRAFT_552343 [Powellomyces hirtus]